MNERVLSLDVVAYSVKWCNLCVARAFYGVWALITAFVRSGDGSGFGELVRRQPSVDASTYLTGRRKARD